ncbi:MAG: hypothetical protein Q8R24_06965 [Legionellaceae bacterium]|nr:hypothetical protein [Legionellaceae bacterium]
MGHYAQGASAACIGDYVARWTSWCAGVLKYCSGQFVVISHTGQEKSRQLGSMDLPKKSNHEKIHINHWIDKVHYAAVVKMRGGYSTSQRP